jgi:hypothetical protein
LTCDEVKAVVATMEMLLLEQVGCGIRWCVHSNTGGQWRIWWRVRHWFNVDCEWRIGHTLYKLHPTTTTLYPCGCACLSAVYNIQGQQVNGGSTEPLSRKRKQLRLQKEARLRKVHSNKTLQISWILFKRNRHG